MRRLTVCVLAVTALALGLMSGYLLGRQAAGADAAGTARTKWVEGKTASVPKAWGDLVGVSTFNVFTVLIFRDSKGTLRRVQWNSSGSLSPAVHSIERKY